MEIKLGIGLGEIKFGISEDNLKNILGTPYGFEENEYKKGLGFVRMYYYSDFRLTFCFESKHNYRLTDIFVSEKGHLLNGVDLFGMNMQLVEKHLKELQLGDSKLEEIMSDDFFIDFREDNIRFHFETEKLSDIQFGCDYLDDETPIWPI